MRRSIILLFAVTMVNSERFWFFGHQYSRTLLGDNIDRASMKMLKEAYLSSDDSNVVTSPLGVILLLSLYSSGAAGKSRDEISALLGASEYTELHDSYGRVSNEFASMDSNFLVLANKMCIADGYTITEELSNTAQSYNSEVDVIDFSDSKSAAEIINQWADQMSKGYIRNPVSEDLFNEEIAVALFNVIYFQGHWHVPFQAWMTEEKDFHVNRSLTVKKPMMHLQQSLFYHENNDLAVKMIELPYQEDGFRMVVILPNEVDGLSSIIEKVADIGILADVFALRPVGKEINLYMPKFDINSKLDYAEILPKLGVNGIFEEGAWGIVKERDVVISKIFQEAFVKVDEEGATAGAFTGAIAIQMSSNSKYPEPMDFIVDHPFLFAILHKDIILFTGIYTH